MKILVFDNYDSFTYNLVHLVEKVCTHEIEVHRNDKIGIEEIDRFNKIILSPGPGVPSEAGILIPLIKKYAASKSIFGVCLGQQAIAEAFGGTLLNLPEVYHGIETPVNVIKEDILFKDIPKKQFTAGRYHSWVVDKKTLPSSLTIIAEDSQDNIMALRHNNFDVCGVQFHPESIMTQYGEQIIKNWIKN